MDDTAPKFHAATADLNMDTYEQLLDDHTKELGTLQMQRDGTEVRAIVAFTGGHDARTLYFQGKTVRVYFPNLKSYKDYQLGSSSQVLNQFLLLGFGSSGKELAANYSISDGGSETIENQSATKLILIPKSDQVKQHLTKVFIWIPSDVANPVQQQFFEPNGNFRKVTYSNIKINPPIEGKLKLKLPGDAKRQPD
jgi:outer membrane lipoprotein-sorting protein